MTTNKAKNTDEFIAGFPKETQKLLTQLRATIQKAAPKAEETMTYGVPAFALNGNLVCYSAFKNHIGLYPTPSGIEAFKKELSDYKTSKGAIIFPLDKPLPLSLITKIVKFRVKENLEK